MRERKFRLAKAALPVVLAVVVYAAVGANRENVVQAQRLETVEVSIRSNGIERQVCTAQTTVGAALKNAGVKVSPLDKVTPALTARLYQGMQINLVHIYDAIETMTKSVAFDTIDSFSKQLRPGRVKIVRHGVKGKELVRYMVRYQDGKIVRRRLLDEKLIRKPVNETVRIGSRGSYASRGGYVSRSTIRMVATGYDPGPRCCGKWATGRTYCGLRAGYGVAAVDPTFIRLGSKLYVEGYGYAIAGDVGRAIKGNRIDLGFDSYAEAKRFGIRTVIVHILQE